ncbi:hypothetical protein [Actinophytocola algeriensis]|uniref:Uncharacterized protein n=1 Tax=Actinophytocola algeriensis TaxID=1768010 RepID=A0A7W7Q9L2_9PSEU|nr:hypothetical protein [Actinophytocola algeriensis]MBB4909587.1 hypothetical protein [Actinophytocola algeriensis]MBE1475577.1 hypothetical protein [Actinophytocola algeriensis]
MNPRTTASARRRARSFRLGEQQEETPLWRRVLPAVLAFVVGAVVFGVGGYLVGKPSEEAQMAADIRASDAARDKVQIKELTDLARTTADDLAPVVEGLAGHEGDATAWQRAVEAAAASFDDPPSGTTATNVARGSLATAIDQLALAVTAHQQGNHDLATRQRDLAVTTWSVGATQLDQINVDAGYGHQHVYLQSEPGGEAFTPDGEPEGHGHN